MHLPLFPLLDRARVTRRTFLAGSASLAAAALWANHARGAVTGAPRFSADPFSLGVASGDPAPDGVVLWTRLAPEPLTGGGMAPEPVEVIWEVAEDEAMGKMVRTGKVMAVPEWAHSVHVEVDGLQPDRWYWYRFRVGLVASPVGRTRTLPPPDAMPERLRLAFASCQHYETGYYTAYEHMLAEHPDLVIHLGDYIYEGGGGEGKHPRKHVGPELMTLEHYRNRHAQYKTDAALQAIHAAAPWLLTWDDHEVANNYANDIPAKEGMTREAFLQRRAAAYQAYYEHMPLRRLSIPQGPAMQMYRRVSYGRLADFFVLDTRQYRTDQPCGDGTKPPCDGMLDPQGTIMGETQREWLFDGLGKSTSKWNVLAQQVMMARVDRTPGPGETYSMDQWPGYELDRRRVLKYLHERKIGNPVVLTGDIHSNWANNLTLNFEGLDGASVATEFVGTSISSSGDGTLKPKGWEQILSDNPFVKFHSVERGYVTCDLTPKRWHAQYRGLEYVTRPGSPVHTRAEFVVEDGRAELQTA